MKLFYSIFKAILFITGGILLLIFYSRLIQNDSALLPYPVGAIITYYGLEKTVILLIGKEKIRQHGEKLLNGLFTLLLGIVVLTRVPSSELRLEITCVLWAVWAIMREGEEINEKVLMTWDAKPIAILNALESVVVIVLSMTLLLDPNEHHAASHLILLAIELFLEVSWKELYRLYRYAVQKYKAEKE